MSKRFKELAKTALTYDNHNDTKLVFHFPDASIRTEFLGEIFGSSKNCKEGVSGMKTKMTYEELHNAVLFHITEGPSFTAQTYAILALAEAVHSCKEKVNEK